MKIAIDARMYGTAQRGIGRYLMKLIENLERVSPPSGGVPPLGGESIQFTIFLRRANFEEYQPRNPNFKKALWDAPWYGWREQVSGVRCQVSGVDLTHFPHWNVPLFFKRPFVVTIHDLELFSSNRTRESTTRGRLAYWLKHLTFRVVFRHAVLASRAIIVPSHAVKEQLLDMYPQVHNKVQVIYEAPTIERLAASAERLDAIDTIRYPLDAKRYALYVGAAYPHKNLSRLLEAWEAVHKELPDYKLVLVGREDYFWKKLKQMLSARRYPLDAFVFHGEATDAELAALYKNAALLIQPSLEEGFGLPPLEALSFGCPVAVSDIPVHHEILGKAAFFFDPHDVESIAAITLQALTDKQARLRMRDDSTQTLRRYGWTAHASQTKQVYEICRP